MEIQNKSSDIIYHYTSIDALYEILLGHSFRLTNLQSSNDEDELYFNGEKLENLVDQMHSQKYDKITIMFMNELKNSIQVIKARILPPETIYSASFTDAADSLYHWKMYADNMKGICLGLNRKALKMYTEHKIEGSVLLPVAYDDCVFENSWGIVANKLAHSIFKYICSENESEYDKYLNDCGEVITTIFLRLARAIKKKKYFDVESEIRMIYAPQLKKDIPSIHKCIEINEGTSVRDKFMVTKNGIRQFITIKFNNEAFDKVISEIILGPHCTQNPDELKAFLRENRVSQINVKRSDIKII